MRRASLVAAADDAFTYAVRRLQAARPRERAPRKPEPNARAKPLGAQRRCKDRKVRAFFNQEFKPLSPTPVNLDQPWRYVFAIEFVRLQRIGHAKPDVTIAEATCVARRALLNARDCCRT